MVFVVYEVVIVVLYDRDDVKDFILFIGEVFCCLDLEGFFEVFV